MNLWGLGMQTTGAVRMFGPGKMRYHVGGALVTWWTEQKEWMMKMCYSIWSFIPFWVLKVIGIDFCRQISLDDTVEAGCADVVCWCSFSNRAPHSDGQSVGWSIPAVPRCEARCLVRKINHDAYCGTNTTWLFVLDTSQQAGWVVQVLWKHGNHTCILYTCTILTLSHVTCKTWNNESFSDALREYCSKDWNDEDLMPSSRCVMRGICTTRDTTYSRSAQRCNWTSLHLSDATVQGQDFCGWQIIGSRRMPHIYTHITYYHIISHICQSWQSHEVHTSPLCMFK